MASGLRTAPSVRAQGGPSPAQVAQMRQHQNWQYLNTCVPQHAVCVPASGSGLTQTYVAGSTLIYDVPTGNGSFLDGFLFECALTVNPATGTGATYALNAGAPWTLMDNIEVTINNSQFKIKPYILPYLYQLQGYVRPKPSQSVAGQTVTNTTTNVWGTPFALTTATANPWNFYFYLPLRWIPRSAAGMIPVMSDSTKVQIKVQCASQADGLDPILNTVAGANTGHAVVVGGTIKVLARTYNGVNLSGPAPLSLDLTGESTVQAVIDRTLNPLSAGLVNSVKVDAKQRMIYLLSVVVDGNQSTKFAADSNIGGIALFQDSNLQNAFFKYGNPFGTNVDFTLYRHLIRSTYGQDLDEGVILWAAGPSFVNGIGNDVSNLLGNGYLDASPGHWTDINLAVQPTTVSSTNFTPRMETYVVYENTLGLVRS
jgi:hypothetical protein